MTGLKLKLSYIGRTALRTKSQPLPCASFTKWANSKNSFIMPYYSIPGLPLYLETLQLSLKPIYRLMSNAVNIS